MKSVITKTLYDRRFFMFGWWLGFGALSCLMVIFFPAMKMDGSLDQLLANIPQVLQGFVGELPNLKNFSTYLASQLFDIRMQLIGGVMAIILGLGLSVGEEDTGITRTLLSLPISRTKLLIQKWIAMLVIIATVVTGAATGILLTQSTIGEAVDVSALVRLLIMSWLVMVVLATITFSVAQMTGSRSISTAVAIFIVVGGFILSTFSVGVEWLQDYEFLSIFHYYPAVDIARGNFDTNNVVVLSTIMLSVLIVALVFFRRRDVR